MKELQDFTKVPKRHPDHKYASCPSVCAAEEACLEWAFPDLLSVSSNDRKNLDGWLVAVVGQGYSTSSLPPNRRLLTALPLSVCWALNGCGATFASRTQMVVFKGFDEKVVQENKALIQKMYRSDRRRRAPERGYVERDGKTFKSVVATTSSTNSSTAATNSNELGRSEHVHVLKFMKTAYPRARMQPSIG